MTPSEAKMVLAVLTAAFPDAKGGVDTVVVYTEALLDLDYAIADQAVRSLIVTEQRFMPRIGQIRERYVELRDGGVRTGLEAWSAVRKAIGRYGVYRTPGVDFAFADPIVAVVVESIGWRELCNGDIDNQVADRARFIQAYDQIARDDTRSRQAGGLLPGRVSAQRQLRGEDPMVPLAKLLPAPGRMPWEEE